MEQKRLELCKYYICFGKCKKGKDANHWHYCQYCNEYVSSLRRKFKRNIV